MRRLVCVVLAAATGCGAAPKRPLQLRRVILYQNGLGYFERSGVLSGNRLDLQFSRPELDDVLKTLTVIDRLGGSVATVDVPVVKGTERTIGLGVRLGAGRAHDLLVGYAVPTPTWKAAYRIVLDDKPEATLLQGWAMVNNATEEDWSGIALTLATGAPMSFANELSKPQYVSRPDATGKLIAPTVLGPIDGEQVVAQDSDADGIVDSVDECPEDVGAHDSDDGCPEERSLAIMTNTSITVLMPITFPRGSDALTPAMVSIIDATATTLREHADVARVEIGGHAAADEPEPWGLSSRRAAAVQAAMIERGVAQHRLVIAPYGATQLVDKGTSEAAHARNRRVEFLILERERDRPARNSRGFSAPVIDAQTAQASVRTRTKPMEVAGAVRYQLGGPVSIRRGASSMVSIINKPVPGEDVFLFRPDGNAPGSARHPFRAVRFVNKSGFTLEPGPVAIFARGSFVGDTLLGRVDVDETTWIPYALDGGTTVDVELGHGEQPVRLVSIQRGVVTVESSGIRTTRYTVRAGREASRTIFLRHVKTAAHTPRELPPNAIDQGDAWLIPLPLAAAKTAVLTIDERQPRRRTIALASAGQTELGAYLENAPPDIAERLRATIALREELGAIDDELATQRLRFSDLASRADEIRRSLRALDSARGQGVRRDPGEESLRKQLVASLAQISVESDAAARDLGARTAAMWATRTRLAAAIRELALDEKP